MPTILKIIAGHIAHLFLLDFHLILQTKERMFAKLQKFDVHFVA
jgi:hypothetical protein